MGFEAIWGNPEYEFITREGILVRPTKEGKDGITPVGKAYSFFECKASGEGIAREISKIHKRGLHPEKLELSLMDVENFERNVRWNDVRAIATEARQAGMNYVLEGSSLDTPNRNVANELRLIMNDVYLSHLYRRRESYGQGNIVYKEGREFVALR